MHYLLAIMPGLMPKKKKNRCDFSLVKREQPVQDFTFIAISDPQARNEEQLDRFASENCG